MYFSVNTSYKIIMGRKVYRPHILTIFVMYISILLLGAVAAIFYIGLMQGSVSLMIVTGLGCVIFFGMIYQSLSTLMITICFESDGVFIVNDGKWKSQFIPWEKFSYAYFYENNRNHLYLILADTEISEKEQKTLVSSSFQKQLSNGIFYMRMFELGIEEQVHIEETINKKIPNVRGYATLLSFDENGKLRY